MANPYFIVSIETVPIEIEKYINLDEDSKRELLNPIDSKIIAIGIRCQNKNKIFCGENEKEILDKFWFEWNLITKGSSYNLIIGFNISSFDIPFIATRSFINGNIISPFSLKQMIDLRDKINAYRYGKTRGKLKEYASLLKLKTSEIEGKDIAKLYSDKDLDKIKSHLSDNLKVIEGLYKRAVETNIIKINRW
ncbi:MAG: hypothetical protein DRP06_02505 [Candidatus Aenigmatarchaeota archaeon]|nr:MAG: hypothetical protein DRP06_02505 [Candidatus Aenigmarchaeota archaeon]